MKNLDFLGDKLVSEIVSNGKLGLKANFAGLTVSNQTTVNANRSKIHILFVDMPETKMTIHFGEASIQQLMCTNFFQKANVMDRDRKALEKKYGEQGTVGIQHLYYLKDDTLVSLSETAEEELVSVYLCREPISSPTAMSVFPDFSQERSTWYSLK